MKILVVGSGGREHAIAWKCAQSLEVDEVIVAPGNAGTHLEKKLRNINIPDDDIEAQVKLAKQEKIDLTIVGPETPLTKGIVDRFERENLHCFGPNAKAAQLEGSKAFTKQFLARHKIPTADYKIFTEVNPALEYVSEKGAPIVIKADGLAGGKGVIVALTIDQAHQAIRDVLENNSFGDAGSMIVIEEFLEGEEASFIVITDGKTVLPLATSQDHKTRDNGDKGPNTGGMGAYSPAPIVTRELNKQIMHKIIYPTLRGLAEDDILYRGFLYAGVMVDKKGEAKVLEYNCRFGDPETQPIMVRLKSDLVKLCQATLEGSLDKQNVEWDSRISLGVVMASGGYPEDYETGHVISGINDINNQNCKVFHAGTKIDSKKIITSGGRVLCVVGMGNTTIEAKTASYEAVSQISWKDEFHRNDIGYRAIKNHEKHD